MILPDYRTYRFYSKFIDENFGKNNKVAVLRLKMSYNSDWQPWHKDLSIEEQWDLTIPLAEIWFK